MTISGRAGPVRDAGGKTATGRARWAACRRGCNRRSVLGVGRVVELSTGDSDNVELAMTEEALTGFLSWLEASPPGSHLADMA